MEWSIKVGNIKIWILSLHMEFQKNFYSLSMWTKVKTFKYYFSILDKYLWKCKLYPCRFETHKIIYYAFWLYILYSIAFGFRESESDYRFCQLLAL